MVLTYAIWCGVLFLSYLLPLLFMLSSSSSLLWYLSWLVVTVTLSFPCHWVAWISTRDSVVWSYSSLNRGVCCMWWTYYHENYTSLFHRCMMIGDGILSWVPCLLPPNLPPWLYLTSCYLLLGYLTLSEWWLLGCVQSWQSVSYVSGMGYVVLSAIDGRLLVLRTVSGKVTGDYGWISMRGVVITIVV